MLGTIQADSRFIKSCLARYRQNHAGYNTGGFTFSKVMFSQVQTESCWVQYRRSHIGCSTDRLTLCIIQSHVEYSTDRLTVCIIQNHVGYNTDGVTLGTVQIDSRCV